MLHTYAHNCKGCDPVKSGKVHEINSINSGANKKNLQDTYLHMRTYVQLLFGSFYSQ